MLADPVEGFLSGLGSGVTRTFVAFGAILCGAAVCYLSLGSDLGWSALYLWAPLLLGLLFGWSFFGVWFLVGWCAFLVMMLSAWAFIHERVPKVSFFAIFTAAAVYFSPICFGDERWVRAIVIYCFISTLYWVLPQVLLRLNRNA
jgi:hypothetical protein